MSDDIWRCLAMSDDIWRWLRDSPCTYNTLGLRANTDGGVAPNPKGVKAQTESLKLHMGKGFTMPNPPGGGIWPGLPQPPTLPSYMPAYLHGVGGVWRSLQNFIMFRCMLCPS